MEQWRERESRIWKLTRQKSMSSRTLLISTFLPSLFVLAMIAPFGHLFPLLILLLFLPKQIIVSVGIDSNSSHFLCPFHFIQNTAYFSEIQKKLSRSIESERFLLLLRNLIKLISTHGGPKLYFKDVYFHPSTSLYI